MVPVFQNVEERSTALLKVFSVTDNFKWFWMDCLHRNMQLMLEFPKAPFLVLYFSYYTLMTFLMMLSVSDIAIYADDTTLYPKCDQAPDLWQQLELASELESDLQDIKVAANGRTWLVDLNAGKSQQGLTFSSKLDWDFLIFLLLKWPPRKLGP